MTTNLSLLYYIIGIFYYCYNCLLYL